VTRLLEGLPATRFRTSVAPAAAILAAVAILLAAGCGSSSPVPGRLPGASAQVRGECPGVVGATCPYTRVTAIGRRGEGVLRCPEALAFAPDGDLYVADQFSHVVQRFSPGGRFLGQWGSYGSGPGQFGAVDGLAVDAAGDVYVLDSTGDRIERFSAGGLLLGSWGRRGSGLGEFDFGAGEGPDKPPGGGIAVGGRYVYVSDTADNRIERFDLDGSGATVWGLPGSAPGRFSSPRGLAVVGDEVYVADEGNHRVQALDLQGRALYREGSFGTGPGQFVNPFGVAVHGDRVYVVDDNNNRIVALTRDLGYVSEWSGGGRYALSYIRAAATDAAGRVYVADTGHERVVVFDGEGRGVAAWGVPGIAPGQFVAPLDVATDAAGDVLVVETYGSRSPVYLFDSALAYRTRWERGGGAILGSHWFGPTAAAVAADGTVWITDPANDLVRHLGPGGAFLGALGDPGGEPGASAGASPGAGAAAQAVSLLGPNGVAVGPSGEVYVADTGHGRVARFAADGRPLGTLGGTGAGDPSGSAGGSGAGAAGATGTAALVRPVAVAAAPSGDLYAADAGDDRIVELSPAGTLLATWGGPGSAPGRFSDPAGIAVDAAGDVFVSDRGNDRVQKFAPDGRLLAAWGAPGGGLGQFSSPTGLATDCRGDVLVADTENNRVQVFAGAAARSSCVVAGGLRLGL
jgi:tripartite motif-containing protein 71